MMKLVGFFAALATFGAMSSAQADINTQVLAVQQSAMVQAQFSGALNWKVGDKASYSLENSMMNGTVDTYVKSDTGTGFWVNEDLHLSMMGDHVIEILINKTNGKIEKMLLDGKDQQIPDNDQEIVETRGEHVKVPAGEFDCLYAKIKSKKDGSISEAWLNPKLVPVLGMVKMLANSQMGQIKQELTSYQFVQR